MHVALETDGGDGGAVDDSLAAVHVEVVDLRAAGGVELPVLEGVENRGDFVLGVHAHPAVAVVAHAVAVVDRNAVDLHALPEDLVPAGGVHVHVAVDGASAVPDLHGEIAPELLEIPGGGAAPFRVAVDRQIALRVDRVEIGLIVFLPRCFRGVHPFVLIESVPVLFRGPDADGVETAEAVAVLEGAVEFHAGDDGDGDLRREILIVIEPVVGQRQKIVPVFRVETDHFIGFSRSVGSLGVAVEPALEQFCAAAECLLSFHGENLVSA